MRKENKMESENITSANRSLDEIVDEATACVLGAPVERKREVIRQACEEAIQQSIASKEWRRIFDEQRETIAELRRQLDELLPRYHKLLIHQRPEEPVDVRWKQ
jgi:CHASE3 domain sensor protein